MSLRVTAVIQQDNGWYTAKCLENDAASQGRSIEEAMDMLKEALELYYEDSDEVPVFSNTFVTTMEIAL